MKRVKKITYCFDDLPKTKTGKISWRNTVGHYIEFSNGSFSGKINIINYEVIDGKSYITVEYLNKTKKVLVGRIRKDGEAFNNLLLPKCLREARIGDIIKKGTRKFIVLGVSSRKLKNESEIKEEIFYRVRCLKCKNDTTVHSSNLYKCVCKTCSGHETVYGCNDITTTDPWMIPFFKSEKEARKYRAGSADKIKPICPRCGKQHDKEIALYYIKNQVGFRCKYCNDNTPITEKIIICLLDQLQIPYVHLAKNKDLPFDCERKEYDFYLPTFSSIIETHGKQHYEDSLMNGHIFVSAEEVQRNDKYKYELARHHVDHYVIIDCKKSNFNYIKNSIINSDLLSILGVSMDDIDWDDCKESSVKTLRRQICQDYHEKFMTVDELAQKYNKSNATIYSALKLGTELGWCSYKHLTRNTHLQPVEICKNGKHIAYAKSTPDLSKKLRKYINPNSFSETMLHKALKKGTKYLNEYDVIYVNDIPLKWDIINGLFDDELAI